MQREYSDSKKYAQARKKVERIKGFYSNLILYLIVIPFLIVINLKFMPEFQWFWFPMLGWGLGITFQGLHAFNQNFIFGKNWEERKISELIKKENNRL